MRIRSVHPDQWTQESFVQCSPLARLLALGLRNEADDNGVFPWKPLQLKMRVLPGDACDIDALLGELTEAGLIWRYTIGEDAYGAIYDWASHQRPQRPSYVHPTPEEPWPAGFHFKPVRIEDDQQPVSGPPQPIHDRSAPETKTKTESEEKTKTKSPIEGKAPSDRSANIPPTPSAASGTARSVGSVLSSEDADATAQLARRIVGVTGDPPAYEAWWRNVIERMEATDGIQVLYEAQRYASMCGDPDQRAAKDLGELKHPGGYIAAKCRDWLHRHGKRLPPPPGEAVA